MVLNHKSWQHYQKDEALTNLYIDLYEKANDYAWENLKGEELNYFYNVTD